MKFKDEEPIQFEFLQSDMEKLITFLDAIMVESRTIRLCDTARAIKYDLQNKIDFHKEEGDWK